MFSNRYRYLIIAFLGTYTFANILYMEAIEYYGLHVSKPYLLLLILVISVLIWEGNRAIEIYLNRLRALVGRKIHPMLLAFLLSLVVTLLAIFTPAFVLGQYVLQLPDRELRLGMKLILATGFRINLFLNTLNVVFFFLKQLRESQVEAEQFRKMSLQAQFQSLKDQVNPHFLFNNLNVLSTLVYKDPEVALEFIQQFSNVYRYVLQSGEKELVEVSEEINFMASYVYLLRTRFSDSLDIQIDLPHYILNWYTVPVALQMLMENAIKHNISSKNKPLRIEVFVGEGPSLVVRNNIQPKQKMEESTHIGLKNIARRYDFVSGKKVEVVRDADWFMVKLPLLQLSSYGSIDH